MPNQKINVKLTLEDQNGTTGWHMDMAGVGKGGPKNYPKAKANYGNNVDFQFVITGKGTSNVTFSDDPIWVAPDNGSGKSPAKPGVNTGEITGIKGGGTKVLTFTDLNTVQDDLTYQLNFNNAAPLDPIITNNGGGPPGFHYEYLIGAVVLGIVALWMIRKVVLKKPATPTPNPNSQPSVSDDKKG